VHTTSDIDNSVAGAVWRRPVREAVCGVPYRAPLRQSSLGGPYRAVRRTPGATCGVAVWGSLVDRAIWPGFYIGGYSPGVRRQMIGGADLAVWQSGDR
jgi:hypothetical protein